MQDVLRLKLVVDVIHLVLVQQIGPLKAALDVLEAVDVELGPVDIHPQHIGVYLAPVQEIQEVLGHKAQKPVMRYFSIDARFLITM